MSMREQHSAHRGAGVEMEGGKRNPSAGIFPALLSLLPTSSDASSSYSCWCLCISIFVNVQLPSMYTGLPSGTAYYCNLSRTCPIFTSAMRTWEPYTAAALPQFIDQDLVRAAGVE